ncbi:DUF4157 domain-containing protein [Streptomyces sp. NPDC058195]|uniref:eCIS core domain-containing protein n=1 Tax=Streptomyces sp. NPDC058195 TaxID=3346375 RepID=UPI0036E9756E
MHTGDQARPAKARKGRSAAHHPQDADRPTLPGLLPFQSSLGNAAVVQMLRHAGHPGVLDEHGAEHGSPWTGRAGQDGQTERPVQRSTVHDVLRSPGRPLDEASREEMERRLGADFSDVRLHTGSAARASAAEVGARAYTSGHHVVLGEGGGDRHTLAHELTHVIQQRSGPVAGTDNGAGLRVSDPSDRFEREAEATARRVLSTRAPQPAEPRQATASPSGPAAVQRMPAGPKKPPEVGSQEEAKPLLSNVWDALMADENYGVDRVTVAAARLKLTIPGEQKPKRRNFAPQRSGADSWKEPWSDQKTRNTNPAYVAAGAGEVAKRFQKNDAEIKILGEVYAYLEAERKDVPADQISGVLAIASNVPTCDGCRSRIAELRRAYPLIRTIVSFEGAGGKSAHARGDAGETISYGYGPESLEDITVDVKKDPKDTSNKPATEPKTVSWRHDESPASREQRFGEGTSAVDFLKEKLIGRAGKEVMDAAAASLERGEDGETFSQNVKNACPTLQNLHRNKKFRFDEPPLPREVFKVWYDKGRPALS